jgi:hypothetical protein
MLQRTLANVRPRPSLIDLDVFAADASKPGRRVFVEDARDGDAAWIARPDGKGRARIERISGGPLLHPVTGADGEPNFRSRNENSPSAAD